MLHAYRRGPSQRQDKTERQNKVGRWRSTHVEAMGRVWLQCPRRNQRIHSQQTTGTARRSRGRPADIRVQQSNATEAATTDADANLDRKMYPLRGRLGLSDLSTRYCSVVLTRLEETSGQVATQNKVRRSRGDKSRNDSKLVLQGKNKRCKCQKRPSHSSRASHPWHAQSSSPQLQSPPLRHQAPQPTSPILHSTPLPPPPLSKPPPLLMAPTLTRSPMMQQIPSETSLQRTPASLNRKPPPLQPKPFPTVQQQSLLHVEPPKSKPPESETSALCLAPGYFQEPRKRRLASLNAEAVNSLLLDRQDPQQTPRLSKKQQQQQQKAQTLLKDFTSKTECTSTAKDSAKVVGCSSKKAAHTKKRPQDTEGCPSPKSAKRARIDAEEVDLLSLYTPTPRRLAGLNAAALLKLTSTSAGGKRRVKTECKPSSDEALSKQQSREKAEEKQEEQQKSRNHHHHRHHHHHHCKLHKQQHRMHKQQHRTHQQGSIRQHKHRHRHRQQQLLPSCCSLCKKEAYHKEGLWEGPGAGGHDFIQPGYQCRSLLSYPPPLKSVKEEQTDTEVNQYFCCSSKRSVEYCHRLALFLDQKAFPDEEEHPLPSGFLAHPAALSLNAHPYPCYSGYYVHIAHHGSSSPPPISSNTVPVPYPPPTPPAPVGPITLCSSGVRRRPKLMPSPPPPSVSHPPGIPHPGYCGSVGACYGGESCRMGPFAYRGSSHLQPRGCSYSPDCSSCNRNIKMEEYPYPRQEHSPSIPVSPPQPLSVCPMPSVPPPSPQSVPHLQAPHSDSTVPQSQLRVARECPQSAKPPSGSRSGARVGGDGGIVTSPPSLGVGCPHRKEKQQGRSGGGGGGGSSGSGGGATKTSAKLPQKISRRRATNGWVPVGMPTEKEVFVVGEETAALRQCYEGVQRGGEIIRVRDTVLLRSGPRKKSLPYVAKVSAFWEDPETDELMMSLFWYYRPEHTQGGRNPLHCENEIFASRHQDENSVACIEDKCYVLTLAQYCRFCALMKRHGDTLAQSSPLVPPSPEYAVPSHRLVPSDVDPQLVFFCRHVYDFRYGRLLKNLQ